MQLERTPEAQRHFDSITDGLDRSEEPTKNGAAMDPRITATDPSPHSDYDMFRQQVESAKRFSAAMNEAASVAIRQMTQSIFDDDTPIAPTCNTENPEACEACD